jgi:hypothetical protein
VRNGRNFEYYGEGPLHSDVLTADHRPIPVLAPGNGKTKTSRL